MSYLARMLARAVGESGTAATPRLPSWFESAPESAGPSDWEPAVAEPPGTPAEAGPETAAAQPSRTRASRPVSARPDPRSSPDHAAAHGRDTARAAAHQTGPRQPLAGQPPTAGESVLPRPLPPDAGPLQRSGPSAAQAPTGATPQDVGPRAPAAAPVPAVPRPPAPTGQPAHPAPPQPSGAPGIVEVAIGRIEVRATIAPPATPPVREAAPPSRPVLSLADYLTGTREAR